MSKARTDRKIAAEGRCRMCERAASVRPLTRHRLVPGCDGGQYVLENVVPLCRPCHDLVDNFKGRMPHRRMLRMALWPMEVAYVIRRKGRAWFDREYPPTPRAVAASAPVRQPDPLPRHLRACKASAGGCVYGCPVADMRERLAAVV